MKLNDENFHRWEGMLLRTACIILLAITLAGIIRKEAQNLFISEEQKRTQPMPHAAGIVPRGL